MIDLNLIGNRIRDLRHQKGLTQSEFAKILSVSFQAVSSWDRGITPPDIENLINMSVWHSAERILRKSEQSETRVYEDKDLRQRSEANHLSERKQNSRQQND